MAVLAVGLVTVPAQPALATEVTQGGCTFSVPKPTVYDSNASMAGQQGKVKFTLTVKCTRSTFNVGVYDDRQVVIDLKGDDPCCDGTVSWTRFNARTVTTYTKSYWAWKCDEDWGQDELYLGVRVEMGRYGSWVKKYANVNGAVATGYCI